MGRFWGLLGAVVLAGCLEPAATTCDNGNVCIAPATCLDDGRCAQPGQAEACAALDPGARCEFDTVVGRCHDALCVVPTCGDGYWDPEEGEACDDGNNQSGDGCVRDCSSTEACGNAQLDPGEECDDGNTTVNDTCQPTCVRPHCGDGFLDADLEVCDDGNAVDGDGCAASCNSDETCANGVYDYAAGEECDDGDLLSFDGCSDLCALDAQFIMMNTNGLAGTADLSATYDAARCEIVLFGGRGQAFEGLRLWRTPYTGNVTGLHQPSARAGHVTAYLPARGQVVLFGGYGADGRSLNDTWLWDGAAWQRQSTDIAPDARRDRG